MWHAVQRERSVLVALEGTGHHLRQVVRRGNEFSLVFKLPAMAIATCWRSYGPLDDPTGVITRLASAASATTSEMRARWFLCDTNLEGLSQDLEDMARARGPLIQAQRAMVRQGHRPRQGPLAAADQADSGDRVVGSPERAHSDDGGAPPGEAGDAMDAGRVDGCSQS